MDVKRSYYRKMDDDTAERDADLIARDSLRSIGVEAQSKAPVDTGLLRATLITGIKRNPDKPTGSWIMEQETDYTLRQEIEHKTKSGFIQSSAINGRAEFHERMRERFKNQRRTQI